MIHHLIVISVDEELTDKELLKIHDFIKTNKKVEYTSGSRLME